MCGIAGALRFKGEDLRQEGILDMQRAMQVRGPDASGMWCSENKQVALAHRRLSIIDLSQKASQPMSGVDGRYRIVFNGEIYNYASLRNTLIDKGYVFISEGDTEVLINAYDYYGENLTEYIRGMYSFAVWDSLKNELFLCRDPMGIKPLYYSRNERRFIFSSQVKSIVQYEQCLPSVSHAGTVGFFLWGNVPEPYTTYQGVYSLEPGCSLRVTSNGDVEEKKHFDFACVLRGTQEAGDNECEDSLKEVFLDSVRMHQISDVPVGLFLSAGIDSAVICGLVSETNSHTKAITLGFSEYQNTHDNEVPLARTIADYYQVDHKARYVSFDTFRKHKHQVLEKMDQPSVDGINTYFVSQAAAEAGLKVALSGIGGDEWFGGYNTFTSVPRLTKIISKFPMVNKLGGIFRGLTSSWIGRVTSPKAAMVFNYGHHICGAYMLKRCLYMPEELGEIMDYDVVEQGLRELDTMAVMEDSLAGIHSDYYKIVALETKWYLQNRLLRDTDWASMAHSLEVRTPLVDRDVYLKTMQQGGRVGNRDKRQLAMMPSKRLPASITERKKTGFSIPVDRWIKQMHSECVGMRDWARYIAMDFGLDGLINGAES